MVHSFLELDKVSGAVTAMSSTQLFFRDLFQAITPHVVPVVSAFGPESGLFAAFPNR